MRPIRAVILAGDSEKGDFMRGEKIKNKAFFPINKRPMLCYVLDVLVSVSEISEIVVVGPQRELEPLKQSYDVSVVHNQRSIMDNVKASKFGWDHGRLLIVTSDIPMITVESIKDFLAQTQEFDDELFYPIVRRAKNEEVYPKVKRTYVTLQEGTFTGGNICLVDANCIDKAAKAGERLIALRKSPVKLANFLGWSFLLKLLSKKLTIKGLEQRVSSILELKAKAIISSYPQLGTDVDKDSDIDIAEEYLANLI
ncbi:NTP transferase domain-containing protein [Alkalicella caledoniensis]|uniref:NTP transferase domain-containing protein n=1 Tax=Alkalicella caledoniensis TaxID=2731377 RepID=A0A7G9W869_ALKCA|nr:nucleotidyltransferase family protein [Alkalicella caledoniensis]QNO14881.1 NTP transferase domain-containing protein [Alkalicella caledoniensis]